MKKLLIGCAVLSIVSCTSVGKVAENSSHARRTAAQVTGDVGTANNMPPTMSVTCELVTWDHNDKTGAETKTLIPLSQNGSQFNSRQKYFNDQLQIIINFNAFTSTIGTNSEKYSAMIYIIDSKLGVSTLNQEIINFTGSYKQGFNALLMYDKKVNFIGNIQGKSVLLGKVEVRCTLDNT